MDDQVVVVNENDEVIGAASRDEAHRIGIPHRIAVVYVENPKGEILVQVRMSGKLDHSSAGHLAVGESYIDGAKRELKEELGIDSEITFIGSGHHDAYSPDKMTRHNHFFHIFKCTAEPGELQKEEVRDAYWADPFEMLKEMEINKIPGKFAGSFYRTLKIYLTQREKHE